MLVWFKIQRWKNCTFWRVCKEIFIWRLNICNRAKDYRNRKTNIRIIDKYSKSKENIYITSFIFEALENVRKFDKDIKISWLIDEEINQNNIDKLLSIKGSQICPKADKVSNSSIELANRNRLGVRLWGIRDEEIMQKVYKLNIEGMTVNFPDKLKVLIEGE